MTQPLLYRINETMKLLSVSRATVYRLANGGHLEMVHIGTAARVTAKSINDMIESGKRADAGYHQPSQKSGAPTLPRGQ